MTEFRLLGSLEVHTADGPVALGGKKQRAVLAILVLNANEVVSVDRLIDGLWGTEVPRTAPASVQNCIWRLRRLLGPGVIETRPPGYVLHAADGEVDTARFASLVHDARDRSAPERVELLTQALGLWRGVALADFAFEEFAQAAVQQLDEMRLEAIEGRIEAQLELGRHTAVIGELEALVGAHRSRERLRYLHMLALYRAKRQVDALEAFQATRLALAEDLGLEPSQELKALERMILEHDPALDVAAGHPATAGPRTSRDVRRIVTVLVVEPILDESLPAEGRRSAAARCLAVAATSVERYGGRIELLEGTELTGTFGRTGAHEDDALRAVRAAGEIRDECAPLGIQVRSGIETAALDVAADPLDGGALTAARSVRDAASGDEILIGPAALRLLSGAVDAVPIADATLFRVLGLIEGAPAVRRRFDAELVGRKTELNALEAAVEAAWQSGAVTSVVVLGEPGIGKTRLATELISRFGDRTLALTGRCVPHGEGTAYLPLADIIRDAIGPGEVHRGILRRSAGAPDGELIAEHLAGVDSEEPARVQAAEIFWAVRRFLEMLAEERPLLVVLDDAHWAETTLLDLVEYLVGWCEAPVAILCLARPELRETRPDWAAAAMVLERLSDVASRELLEALPESAQVDDDAVATILATAEGNPLFLEQLAALAADRQLASGEVPPTLEALLASRLDLLTDEERDVLERAAVIGREFSRDAVDALSPPDELGVVGSSLMALVRRRLMRPDRGAPPGEDGFRFEHILIRDAAYRSVPMARRADTHERLARWLDSRPNPQDEIVGFHLEQASRWAEDLGQVDRLGQEAAARLGEAAHRMIERLETAAAVPLLRRAVGLLADGDEKRSALEIELGYALKNEGALAESVSLLSSVEARSRELGDRSLELRASVELAWPRLVSGGISVAAACSLADEAVPYFADRGDYFAAGRAARMRANADDMSMQYVSAEEHTVSASAYFRRAGIRLHFGVGTPAPFWVVGPTPVSVALDRIALALADPESSPAARGYLQTHLGELQAMRGNADEARELIRQAESAHREFAQSFALTTVWPRAAAVVEALAGDPAAAEAILLSMLEQLDPEENAAWFAVQAGMRVVVLVDLGRIEEAVTLADVARAAAPADELLAQITWRQGVARAYARAGRGHEADQVAMDALDLARATDAPCHLAETLLALAEVRGLAGSPDAAAPLVAEALALLRAKGNVARARQVSCLA